MAQGGMVAPRWGSSVGTQAQVCPPVSSSGAQRALLITAGSPGEQRGVSLHGTLVGTGTLLRLGWLCSSGVKLMGFEELLHLKVGADP